MFGRAGAQMQRRRAFRFKSSLGRPAALRGSLACGLSAAIAHAKCGVGRVICIPWQGLELLGSMVYVLGFALYLFIGTILLHRRADRSFRKSGATPWEKNWHFKFMFGRLPGPQQAIYRRLYWDHCLLWIIGMALFLLVTYVTGAW